MTPSNINFGSGSGGFFTVALILMTLVNFGMAVFWILVGWRAMKAHERLPDALAKSLRDAAQAGGEGESRP